MQKLQFQNLPRQLQDVWDNLLYQCQNQSPEIEVVQLALIQHLLDIFFSLEEQVDKIREEHQD